MCVCVHLYVYACLCVYMCLYIYIYIYIYIYCVYICDHRVKLKESEKRDKYLDFVEELKKLWHSNVHNNCNWYSWYSHQRINKRT